METFSNVIRILDHSNRSLATITMGQHKLPWKRFSRLNSKSVRHPNQWYLSDLETLRPLVYSAITALGILQPRALGFLNHLVPWSRCLTII